MDKYTYELGDEKVNTLSITYNGKIRKLMDYEKLVDDIGKIFCMCDKKVTHWSYSITDKTAGKVRKYRRDKVLFKNLQNGKLEWVSFYALPEDYGTACFDYYIFISINYKYERITAVFDEGILKEEEIIIAKRMLRDYMKFPCVEEVYTMDKEETPLLYAAKVNPDSSFKTLKIISNQRLDEGIINYE